MKVSQLIHTMGRDDAIVIDDADRRICSMTIYTGKVRGIKKDDPINRMNVKHIYADGDVIYVLAKNFSKEKTSETQSKTR